MKRTALASVSAVALFFLVGSVLAQESESQSDNASGTAIKGDEAATQKYESALEEVIVTATRRVERLQDVPLAVTVFSQEELTAEGIVDYEGLAHNTPGTIINRASANFNNFSVRGISTNGYAAGLQSTVSIYIDELPISANGNSTILDPNLWDVDRVEFLRGPQGTLFGANSLAGAVRVISKEPVLNEFDAAALVDLGWTNPNSLRQRYNAVVNLPAVDDKLAFRLVGFYRDEEGYVNNIGTGEDNSNTLIDWGGRAIMLWQPTEKLSFKLMYLTEDSKPEDSSLINPELGDRVRLSDRPDLFRSYLDAYNATISYEFESAELTSSTTYSTYDQDFVVDLAGSYNQAFPFALDAYAYDDIFVEEIRLVSDTGGKFDWVLGAYYNYKRRDVDYNYRSTQEYLDEQGITGLPDEYYSRSTSYFKTHELAGFGTLTYYFKDNLWLTAGLRYTSSDVQGFTAEGGYNSNYLTLAYFGLSGPVTITPVPAAVGDKGEEKGPSYKLSLSYQPAVNMTMYGSISTGFRTPVVNARAGQSSGLDPNDIIIPDGADSDDLTQYEIGLKGNWMNNKLSAHIAAYYIDWNDIQIQANRVSDLVQFATNIGGAISTGVEVELTANPADGLLIGLNGSYNHSEVNDLTDSEAAISGAVDGAQLAFPEWQGNAYLRYDFTYGSEGRDGFFSANVAYVDGYPNMFPYRPGQPGVPSPTFDYTDSYTTVNLSLGSQLNEKFLLIAYIENLFNSDDYVYVHPEAFIENRYGIQRPRTAGLRLSYQY